MMEARIECLCGMICSGKSTLARRLAREENAVILSTDEFTRLWPDPLSSDRFDEFSRAVNALLLRKAVEIARAGANVVLDWGFWSRQNRREVSETLRGAGIPFRWWYLDTPPEQIRRNAEKRNAAGGADVYFVDEGLLQKCLSRFEPPLPDEVDQWVSFSRTEE